MYRWALFLLLASTAWALPGAGVCGSEDIAAAKYPTAKMPPEVQKARQECNGRRYADFTSMDGDQFHDVTGAVADDMGFRFSHSGGAKFLRYDDLPPALQREFLGVSYPDMSAEVMRRRAIYQAERRLKSLEAEVDEIKGRQETFQRGKERLRETQEQGRGAGRERIRGDIAKTQERITALEEEHRKKKADLASFDQPEAIAARRAEMKKRDAEAAAIGRTFEGDTEEKFDARRKEQIKNSIRLAAERVASAKESLASSQKELALADRSLANLTKEVAEREKQLNEDFKVATQRVASARQKLSKQIEESKQKGDDPEAFDRYCKDNAFPRS